MFPLGQLESHRLSATIRRALFVCLYFLIAAAKILISSPQWSFVYEQRNRGATRVSFTAGQPVKQENLNRSNLALYCRIIVVVVVKRDSSNARLVSLAFSQFTDVRHHNHVVARAILILLFELLAHVLQNQVLLLRNLLLLHHHLKGCNESQNYQSIRFGLNH